MFYKKVVGFHQMQIRRQFDLERRHKRALKVNVKVFNGNSYFLLSILVANIKIFSKNCNETSFKYFSKWIDKVQVPPALAFNFENFMSILLTVILIK